VLEVTLPNKWRPRDYQMKAWTALEGGCKRVILAWHRRAGKDDVCLHWAATQAMQRVGNYWHMLPEYAQARKSVWEAVNPHTGKRRIDEAFPDAICETKRGTDMFIRFKNGSTWQLVGSDRFDSLVGSPPIGVTRAHGPTCGLSCGKTAAGQFLSARRAGRTTSTACSRAQRTTMVGSHRS
jgi:phage terminase large subunit